jgi:hypothetical protein
MLAKEVESKVLRSLDVFAEANQPDASIGQHLDCLQELGVGKSMPSTRKICA